MPTVLTEQEFRRLLECRTRIRDLRAAGQVAGPFAPYVGPLYGADPRGPKLAFVGQATGGDYYSGSGRYTLTGRLARAHEVIRHFCNNGTSSQFWSYVRKVTREVHAAVSSAQVDGWDDWRAPLERIYWTNLLKVGIDGRNPQGREIAIQRPFAIDVLRAEVRRRKPMGVVFLTGDFCRDIIDGAFQSCRWRKVRGLYLWTADSEISDSRLYWTRHPRCRDDFAGEREQIRNFIAQDQLRMHGRQG